MPRARFSLLLLLLLPSSLLGQDSPTVFTYSYSNLFDGNLTQSAGLTTFEMVQAIEEAFTIWSEVVPLSFVERPDSGPAPTDDQYLAERHPDIRIGHHDIDIQDRLGHAYLPGLGGLESDVHFDSSSRTWNERFFLSTAVHEIGHAIGLDHFDGAVAIMNEAVGGPNLLPGLGQGFLFQPDVDAIQAVWGVGSGTVTTQRSWAGGESNNWSANANWNEGFRPTENTQVRIQTDGAARIASEEVARSVTLGGATNSLRVAKQGSFNVQGNVALGTRDGGNAIVADAAPVRTLVPRDGSAQDQWFAPEFDDRQWSQGTTGIGFERSTGFEDFIGSDLEAEMYSQNASVYSRIEFNVDDPAELDFLRLRMRYDDGFVAYLNGVEIAAANRPTTLRWNSRATGLHSDNDAIEYVDFEIDSALSTLQQGRNVLAIQGLNYTSNSSDMLISPEIVGGDIRQELFVDGSMTVGGDLALAQDAGSTSQVTVGGGTLTIRGNVTIGQGQSEIALQGGVLRVQGDSTPTVAVAAGAQAHAHVPTDDRLGSDWTASEFDDSAWMAGPTGIGFEQNEGFGDLVATDLSAELYQQNASFYTRIPFDASDVAQVGEMSLFMRFDDGFVAYLNGAEIARANAPNQIRWDSTATTGVDDREAREPVLFDVSQHVDLLRDGNNVLAIHGLNQSPTSTDVLIIPELSFRDVAGTLDVGQLSFSGGQLLDVVRVNGQFNHQQGVFSPSRPGSDGNVPGSIEINGPYVMSEDAVLEMNVDSTSPDQHDVLRLLDGGTLSGTLSIVTNANGGNYNDPTQPGEEHQIELVFGQELEGQFETLLYNGESLDGHHGGGLFRRVIYGDEGVSLLNYQAFAGDANGDGQFDSSDLIAVFRAGQYENSVAVDTDWTEGDWNGDLEFATDDLVLALQAGRYERGAASSVAIPEPTSLTLLAMALLLMGRLRDAKKKPRSGDSA